MNTTKDKALLVSLSIGLPGARKQDKAAASETLLNHQADNDSGNFSKLLLPKEALVKVKEHVTAARQYHYAHSLPWTEEGRRFMPVGHFMEYAEQMKFRKDVFGDLQREFVAAYPGFIEQAKGKLGSLFSETDYPEAEVMQNKFRWELTFDPIPSGADIRLDMQKEDLEALRADVDRRVAAAEEMAQADLYRRLAEPITKMMERLSDPENTFRDTLVTNIQDICDLIPKLSLRDDPALMRLADMAKGLTEHGPKELREDARVRADVAARAKAIADQMQGLYSAPIAKAA